MLAGSALFTALWTYARVYEMRRPRVYMLFTITLGYSEPHRSAIRHDVLVRRPQQNLDVIATYAA